MTTVLTENGDKSKTAGSSDPTKETDKTNTTTPAIPIAGSASSFNYGPNVKVSTHPVLHHKISILRSSSTKEAAFRSVLREITFHLGYEATANLNTKPVSLTVPIGHDHMDCTGKTLVERPALIPILRSGLGMADSMLELLPKARVHHIGMYRQNLMPIQYYNRLSRKCEADVAFVLDPLMATSQTVRCVVGILKKWGVEKIHVVAVIASKQGLISLATDHPDVCVTVGEVDETVSDKGEILPGLGDAGDRLFGTTRIDDEEEELMHPSKRKRSI